MRNYEEDFMGQICFNIFKLHSENEMCYKFDSEADEIYEKIFDKYNAQYNLKYAGIRLCNI